MVGCLLSDCQRQGVGDFELLAHVPVKLHGRVHLRQRKSESCGLLDLFVVCVVCLAQKAVRIRAACRFV